MNKDKIISFSLFSMLTLAALAFKIIFPATDMLLTGLLAGIILRTITGGRYGHAFNISKKIFMPAGILLYGASLSLSSDMGIDLSILLQLPLQITAIYFIAGWFARKLITPGKVSLMIAAGSALCGIPAIIFSSEILGADDDEIGISVLSIMLLGLIGVILYPIVMIWLEISRSMYAYFCATTLHSSDMIKLAAATGGARCLNTALAVNDFRMIFLIPVILLLSYRDPDIAGKADFQSRAIAALKKIPWQIKGAFMIGIVLSFLEIPIAADRMPHAAEFCLMISLIGIGFNSRLERLYNYGGAPFFTGLVLWMTSIAFFLLKNGLFSYR